MGILGDEHTGTDLPRVLAAIQRRVDALETARRLEAATVGRGGIRVRGTGGVRVQDGGGVAIEGGGDVEVQDGGQVHIDGQGGLQITGGGSAEVDDGGHIRARHPDGAAAITYGTLRFDSGNPMGRGLLIQDDGGGDRADIFRALRQAGGTKGIYVGEAGEFADEFLIGADNISLVDSGGIGAGVNGGDVIIAVTRTTGASANLNLSESTGAGFLARSTSSRRYKTDIEDHRTDPARLLALQPRSWRDKGEVAADPDTDSRYVGLVAEEVHDAGLSEYVVYDEQGRPDAVAYDRLAVGLLDALRELTDWARGQGYQPQSRPPAARAVRAVPTRGEARLPPPPPHQHEAAPTRE